MKKLLVLLLGLAIAFSLVSVASYGQAMKYKEAPMLSEMVRAGRLPAVERRLPQDPMVVKPVERPGDYGGTWRRIHPGSDPGQMKMINDYVALIRWTPTADGVQPGLASRWEISRDGTETTIYLRKGVKWSDGVEYTTADILYYWEIAKGGHNNDPATSGAGVRPRFYHFSEGKLGDIIAIDKYTFKFKFEKPYWYIPHALATGFWEPEFYLNPKHYLEKFDPRVNRQYRDWAAWQDKNAYGINPERPKLSPWVLKEYVEGGKRMVYERNPYYWAVDTMGNQLPYIDRVVSTQVDDKQAGLLKLIAGEVDASFRVHVIASDFPLLVDNEKKGDYRVIRWEVENGSWTTYNINLTHPDPVLRKILRDRRFRLALVHAVDKDKLNEITFYGLCKPSGFRVSTDNWHTRDPEGKRLFAEWEALGREFDLAKANALLDEMGLTRRDAQGFRLRPDGKTLTILIDYIAGDLVDEIQIVPNKENWEKIGIKIVPNPLPGAERANRRDLGIFDIYTHGTSEMDLFMYPDWVFPTRSIYWHPGVGLWYQTGGKQGVAPEPGGFEDRLIKIYQRILQEPDINKAHKLVQDAIRIHIDEGPFSIGTVADCPAPVVVKNNFRNVPTFGILGPWAPGQPGATFPEQYFISQR
jgi:peptide/nickel transport system substrate-binding protein